MQDYLCLRPQVAPAQPEVGYKRGRNLGANARTAVLGLDIQTALAAIYTKQSPEFVPAVASVVARTRKCGPAFCTSDWSSGRDFQKSANATDCWRQ